MELISHFTNNTLTVRRIKFAGMTEETLVRIKKKREEKGLSQENLAEALKVNQSTYAKIELGDIRLKVDQLQIIANYLETNINYFLTQEHSEKISDELISDLLDDNVGVYDFADSPSNILMEERIRYLTQINKFLRDQLIKERINNRKNDPNSKKN